MLKITDIIIDKNPVNTGAVFKISVRIKEVEDFPLDYPFDYADDFVGRSGYDYPYDYPYDY